MHAPTPALALLPLLLLALMASLCLASPKPAQPAHDQTPDAAPQTVDAHTRDQPTTQAPSAPPTPPIGQAIRVGGDLSAQIEGADGDFRSGPCRIDTPLPDGYPRPTPPDAIELKSYPAVRLAEYTGAGNPDRGMNQAFWPLFNHIKRHNIAMTSPVEMNYTGVNASNTSDPDSWSMAFLYRRPELNTTGVEGPVTVRDAKPMTVIAVGLKGDYSMGLVQRGIAKIESWLKSNPQWQPDGDWRSLYYNGPKLFWWNKWAEVQLPVRFVEIPDDSPAAAGAREPSS